MFFTLFCEIRISSGAPLGRIKDKLNSSGIVVGISFNE